MTIKWTPADADEIERRKPKPAKGSKKPSTKKG